MTFSAARRAGRQAMWLIALVAPASGHAQLKPQLQTGLRAPVQPKTLDSRRVALIESYVARCMYARHARAALSLLAHSDPVSIDLKGAGLKDINAALGIEECLGGEAFGSQAEIGWKLPAATIRALLAEQGYLASQHLPPQLPDGAPEVLTRDFVSTGDQLSEARGLAAFADCVTFRDVAKADALVRTPPGSPEEHATAAALGPVLGACLTEGQHINLTAKGIRALVADGLWSRFARPALRKEG